MQLNPVIAAVLLGSVLTWSSGPAPAQDGDASEVAGEPSEQELKDAYAGHIASINQRALALFGEEDAGVMRLTLEDLTKLRCEEMERDGVHYDCRVERRLRQAERRPKTDVVQLWLSYEDARWIAR